MYVPVFENIPKVKGTSGRFFLGFLSGAVDVEMKLLLRVCVNVCIYFYPQDCLKCSQYAKQQDPKFRETLDYSVERCVFNFPLFSLYSLKPLLM